MQCKIERAHEIIEILREGAPDDTGRGEISNELLAIINEFSATLQWYGSRENWAWHRGIRTLISHVGDDQGQRARKALGEP